MVRVLEAKGVWKVYETAATRVEALRDVSVKINQGEMVAVMGPSGCGKTTLLNCLSGLDEVSVGKVLVEGVSIFEGDDALRTKVRREQLGFIFQSFNLIPVLSALENVEMPLQLNSAEPNSKEIRKKALSALEKVGLKDWASHKPAELSGGQQQRVTIARAYVHEPGLLLADEPTGNLDTETGTKILDLLVQLNKELNITMMIVTHDIEVSKRCSRTLEMRDGRIYKDTKNILEEE
ncbi:MAG: macrolide ABC transporter ATP-binding protein [Euryarchaeota archaeon]|nr:macrolide ABC transporter ATP-binding protein [Euryarchaeota archaeon]|tara:strand:- start:7072 stop:7779 length:708 start_codon:yes stop_codon:yes gene_type:complete